MPTKRRDLTLRDVADYLGSLPAEQLADELTWLQQYAKLPLVATVPALTSTRLRFEEELRAGRVFAIRRSITAAAAQFPFMGFFSQALINPVTRVVVWRIRASGSGAGNMLLVDDENITSDQIAGRPLVIRRPSEAPFSDVATVRASLAALPAAWPNFLDGVKVAANQEVIFEGPAGAPLAIIEPGRTALTGHNFGVALSLAASTLDAGLLWSEERVS